MRRLYYVAADVDQVDAVCRSIQAQGISNWHLHVLAKDEAGLYTHKIHSANPIQQLDIVHTGLRYGGLGVLGGLVIGLVLYGLSVTGMIAVPIEPWVVAVLTGLGGFFGAWEGGMVGLSRENYQIERYHEEIEAGRYLLMVDVTDEQRPHIKEMMNFDFPEVKYRGAGKTAVNPFKKPKVLYQQTTH